MGLFDDDDRYYRGLMIAAGIAVLTGIIAGAINGWLVADNIDTILDNMERRRAGYRRRNYGWVRNWPFVLPLVFGGLTMFGILWKIGVRDDLRFLVSLSAGALAGYGAAYLVGTGMRPEYTTQIAVTLIVPAALFVFLPITKYINGS